MLLNHFAKKPCFTNVLSFFVPDYISDASILKSIGFGGLFKRNFVLQHNQNQSGLRIVNKCISNAYIAFTGTCFWS